MLHFHLIFTKSNRWISFQPFTSPHIIIRKPPFNFCSPKWKNPTCFYRTLSSRCISLKATNIKIIFYIRAKPNQPLFIYFCSIQNAEKQFFDYKWKKGRWRALNQTKDWKSNHLSYGCPSLPLKFYNYFNKKFQL